MSGHAPQKIRMPHSVRRSDAMMALRDLRDNGTLLRPAHEWRGFTMEIYDFFSTRDKVASLLFVIRDEKGGILASLETDKEESAGQQAVNEDDLYKTALLPGYIKVPLDAYLPRQEVAT